MTENLSIAARIYNEVISTFCTQREFDDLLGEIRALEAKAANWDLVLRMPEGAYLYRQMHNGWSVYKTGRDLEGGYAIGSALTTDEALRAALGEMK